MPLLVGKSRGSWAPRGKVSRRVKKQRSNSAFPDDGPKTDALKSFESNLDQMKAFLDRLHPGGVHGAAKAVQRALAKEIAAAPNSKFERTERKVELLGVATDKYLAFLFPACRWMSVMLVSFVEAYLEDGLIGIAVKNPEVVRKVEIRTERCFEIDNIEELRGEVRSTWAQDALRPGGPMTWRKKLRELGAPRFDDKKLLKIQHLWDTRNLIVHSRCIANSAYAKKYTHFGAKPGVEVKVNLHTFRAWLQPVADFVKWSDGFFLNYGKRMPSRTIESTSNSTVVTPGKTNP